MTGSVHWKINTEISTLYIHFESILKAELPLWQPMESHNDTKSTEETSDEIWRNYYSFQLLLDPKITTLDNVSLASILAVIYGDRSNFCSEFLKFQNISSAMQARELQFSLFQMDFYQSQAIRT